MKFIGFPVDYDSIKKRKAADKLYDIIQEISPGYVPPPKYKPAPEYPESSLMPGKYHSINSILIKGFILALVFIPVIIAVLKA